jgi:rhodanese-related sulfurtransferase
MEEKKVAEITFEEALGVANSRHTKLIWLGREPVDYIRGLLELKDDTMIGMDPHVLMSMQKEEAERLKDSVFVCYHGNTSRTAAKILKDRFGVESYSMKGGVTAIVGEIF